MRKATRTLIMRSPVIPYLVRRSLNWFLVMYNVLLAHIDIRQLGLAEHVYSLHVLHSSDEVCSVNIDFGIESYPENSMSNRCANRPSLDSMRLAMHFSRLQLATRSA